MNLSELLSYLKLRLGLNAISLPFDNPDETMYDTVKTITLPTFSTYCPWYMSVRLNL